MRNERCWKKWGTVPCPGIGLLRHGRTLRYGDGEPYRISIACAERVLFPEVRAAAEEDVLISDGYSCREQIRQGTPREALHLAQVIELAMAERDGRAKPGALPEMSFERERRATQLRAGMRAVGLTTLLACAALGAWRLVRARERNK